MIEGIGYLVFGLLANMLDPVKWIIVSIPAVLLIKTAKPLTPVPNWYNEHGHVIWISTAVGKVLSILYSSEPWVFCFFSSCSFLGMTCWRPSSGSTEAQTRKKMIRMNAMSLAALAGGSVRSVWRRIFIRGWGAWPLRLG